MVYVEDLCKISVSAAVLRFVILLPPLLCYAPMQVPRAVWRCCASVPWSPCVRLRVSPAHPEEAWYALSALAVWSLPARSL